MAHASGHQMTPTRIQQALPAADTVVAFGAVTLTSVLADVFAPVNVILLFFFGVALFCNWLAGILKSYAIHRRSGSKEKWFSVPHAVWGFAKKAALILFVPLAGVVDGTMMLVDWSQPIAELTPVTKAMFVALNGSLCIGAARSLQVVAGDIAIPGLTVLLRFVDHAHTDGDVRARRVTEPLVDAPVPKEDVDG